MTLKNKDKIYKVNSFSLIPVECSVCKRRFIFEFYHYKSWYNGHWHEYYTCKDCIKKANESEDKTFWSQFLKND